jgi:DNA-binding MarR family transcriptional regulator
MTVLDDARRVSAQLDAIRKLVREEIQAQAAAYPVPLTAPQVQALELLVEELRRSGGGLPVTELSRRMGLAHSTVSGIVTRLEDRELVRRTTHAEDRRFVLIELADPVRKWLDTELPAARLAPLADALRRANKRERAAVLDGLATLERVLRRTAARRD